MKFKSLIRECIEEILLEDLNIPSRDGTAQGASEDDLQKAKKATMAGKSVDFVKPGTVAEDEENESLTAEPLDPEMGLKHTDEGAIPADEAKEKVMEVYETLAQASESIADLEDFANESGNNKMKKLTVDLAKHLKEANILISELKKVKDELLEEAEEKASSFGDKVVGHLSKHIKKEGAAEKMKKKYMPFIRKAFQKGKSAKDVADRIKDHRFEI